MDISKEKTKRFEEFLLDFNRILNTKKEPLTFNDFLDSFGKNFLQKKPPKDLRKAIKFTSLNKEDVFVIEEYLKENNNIWFTQHFYTLFSVTKTKISTETMKYLVKKAEELRMNPHETVSLCYYIASLKINGYCGFFKKIIDSFVEDKNYLAGDVAQAAAALNCTECDDSIKSILKSDDKNPRALFFAKDALKMLDKND
ncbi:hypothetical protein HQ529_01805 [Candidatus Woesearchaeota archaeon]|nr:hypothetical protein [Candidatus Woesearchaeota archaeon]